MHLLFIDYEKPFDNIDRQKLFQNFRNIAYSRQITTSNSRHIHSKQIHNKNEYRILMTKGH
jgi:RecA/RadA recombinase